MSRTVQSFGPPTDMAGAAAVPAEPGLNAAALSGAVAERRVCSVLFCDLVGFTPLSEFRDPEEVRELLSRYFAMARTVIGRYGGVVEKFIGDAVMAVWGTPVTLEGDTERAVRAALDLVGAVTALGAEVNAPSLTARAGVVTGEVAVTLGAANEGMVAGDAVNTAARVQSAAAPGAVFVDAATRRLAQAGVEFADAGEHLLKGKSESQRLWRAGRVLSNVGGAQRVDGLEAPVTGRDVELRLIKDLFHASVDRRQPRLVAVTGPAGVGKSRLGWEFEKYVDGLAAEVWWHRGRCLSYGDGVSFWALAEIVRQRLDIAEEDPVEVATRKLTDGLDQFVSDPEERRYIGVRLARLLGLPFSGDAGQDLGREELFAGWRLWFERLAAAGAVVLLVEDLHYADEGTFDFLDHLLDWARDVPIFVITFSRPELATARAGWGSGRNRSLLALDPLDATSMAALLDALVPGIPPAAASAIAGQAQGIPLFAVETIRALIDRDIVVPRDGVYRLVGDVGTLTVPDSLHGLLAARLDALDPSVRALVADAAVLGASFPVEALVAVSGRDIGEVRAALDDLVRREVFEIYADPLSPQRGNYRFAHEMLRQVAYDTLSRRDRKIRHLAVAAHLRATFAGDGEEVVDVIARHYLDALAAVIDDPDVDDVRVQAISALSRAGERAARTGAPTRAGTSLAQAAELTELGSSPEHAIRAAHLLERAATSAMGGGQWATIVDYAERAAAGYTAAGQPRLAARAESIAGRANLLSGRISEAWERLLPAIEVLSENPDADTVMAVDALASTATAAGSKDADRLSTEAVTLGQRLGVSAPILAQVLIRRGNWLSMAGRLAEAAAYDREAARLAEQAGDAAMHAKALVNLSDVLGSSDPAAAAVAARAGAEISRRIGDRYSLSFALNNLAVADLEMGLWDDAQKTIVDAVKVDGLNDDMTISTRALIAALRGDTATADAMLAGLSDLRMSEQVQDRAILATSEAFVASAHHRAADALRHATTTLEQIDNLAPVADTIRWAWPLAARAAHELSDHRASAELLALLDRYQPGQLPAMLRAERDLVRARVSVETGSTDALDADASFGQAVANLRERSTPYHLAHGLLDQAECRIAAGRRSEATELIDEARRIAEKLGAAPLTERARTIAAARGVRAPA